MYLKRLELFGFKSFADKTLLDFEAGITAVVGPNGCGKSNIVDAVRWCLGEQSAKSMRSNQMQDVIFGGSDSRQTTGMAEISLTFDNSQNKLPIDYSEVVVMRRLFRSGESEYFLNKSQCRLKDIRDLFLDTGIGSEGYSVIEQGRVEFLISAKPEERREMFEEAAGVSKYKVRREETLRKLEKVELDMNRINDMLVLLKEQIASLDIAAKKARQYQKSKDELKGLEIAQVVQNIISNQNEIEKIKNSLIPKTKEFETLNTSINRVDAEISGLRFLHTQKDELYIKLQEEFSQIKSGISLADEKISQSTQRESETNERKKQLLDEIKISEERIKQFENEINLIKKELKEYNDRLSKISKQYEERENLSKEISNTLESLIKKETDYRSRLASIDETKEKSGTEHLSFKSLLVACQTHVENLSDISNQFQVQFDPFKSNISSKEKEIDSSIKKAQEIKSSYDLIQNQILETKNKIEKTKTLHLNFKEKLVSAESKKLTLQEWEEKDPLRATIKRLKSQNIEGISGPISSIIKINSGMEQAVASAFGEKLDFMISETVESAKNAIRYLQENDLARITFIVKERIPGINPLSFLTQIGSNTRSILSHIKYDKVYDNVLAFICKDTQIDGNIVYGEALMQGGGRIATEKPILIDEQYKQLNAEIESHGKELSKIEDQHKSFDEIYIQLERKSESILEEYEKINLKIEISKHQLNEMNSKIQNFQFEVSSKQEQIKTKEEEKTKLLEKMRSIENELLNLNAEEDNIKQDLKNNDAEIRILREKEYNSREQLNNSKIELTKYKTNIEARQREELKINENIAAISAQLEQNKKEIENADFKISEFQRIQHEEAEKLREFQKIFSQKESSVQDILKERQMLMNNIEKKNEQIHSSRNKLEEYKQEIHDLEIDKRSFELQILNMQKRLNEDFSLKFDEIKDKFKDVVITDEEITRLKKRIESLGNVNLAAPEEYANLEERYNFLQTQQQDLMKAKEDLHEVIRKINH
ncbi:MAG: chromosome segregation protein SMC, partial [Elusimicrobia bacterium]|nr:chromosome segregation protein SMC [Elusimicrobiota bacterium]